MKLLRFGPAGAEKPGHLDDDGQVRDLSGVADDFAGDGVSLEALDRIRATDLSSLPVVADPGRIGPCLARVANFLCVGLNYTQHAIETGAEPPKEPVLFNKTSSCLSGPNDPIRRPNGSQRLDWEVELGIVIGAETWQVSEDDALDRVAGYCIVNDVSERGFQLDHGGQWTKGKSAPTFGPTGPWLVTPDEVGDVQKLALSTTVNGETMQSSNTDDMIFTVRQIVSYMSRFMKLMPGDLICTGTPEGVGMGRSPQVFLKDGDVMELRIDKLGQQRCEVVGT
ncbi:fumarylacetoacetate hydrolase family protein [Maribius pontilimi]|uniref:Fumarylacetoacetate hydrolase family protein n=1 Tax=Palleronia pontilimi TaxID=1964209 RepID=A0A934MIA0_9RHOB|nr:fumarylacetoacetate hydrolase family protein [Palleronia pontilimi]MBJ3764059.1 fumarylacetoacetate hydrolase family protein [Palleronia pontilimi]